MKSSFSASSFVTSPHHGERTAPLAPCLQPTPLVIHAWLMFSFSLTDCLQAPAQAHLNIHISRTKVKLYEIIYNTAVFFIILYSFLYILIP